MPLGGVESAVNKLTEIDPDLAVHAPYGPNGILDFQFMASFWILVCFSGGWLVFHIPQFDVWHLR